MRAFLSFVALAILIAGPISAEVPNLINYQGRLTDSEGNPAADSTYNISFQMFEHDPPQMGESPLWESGYQPVEVTDGLFVYLLGSATPLPTEVFNDDNLESYYVRVLVEGTMLASKGIQMVTVPFAFRAATADTAMYAHDAPGGTGDCGWTDDGSVVHLATGSDKVGIGTSAPADKLVVGGNLGTTPDASNYVVVRNDNETSSGYKLGYNNDNFGWMQWNGYDGFINFGSWRLGSVYTNTLVLKGGKVGIGQTDPSENLVVGDDLGSFNGNRIAIGDHSPSSYAGLMMGEDSENRAFLTWSVDGNYFDIGIEDGGTQYSQMIKLEDGETKVGIGSGNASVQLPDNAIGSGEILDEPGIARVAQAGPTDIIPIAWTTLCSKSCDFPDGGYAVVMVCAELHTVACLYSWDYGIAMNGTSVARTYHREFGQVDFGDVSCWPWYETLSFHEVFAVSAGTQTFNLMVRQTLVDPAWNEKFEDVSMTIMYFPSQYAAKGETAMTETGPAAQPMLFTSEPAEGRPQISESADETTSESPRRVSSDIQQLRDENAELRRRLEALEARIGK